MAAPLEDDPHDAEAPPVGDRCAELRLESGEVVIYDVERSDGWLQSDGAVDLIDSR